MTDKERIAILEEKIKEEDMSGSIIGGTGIKYCIEVSESGEFQYGLYVPEIKTLFFPLEVKDNLVRTWKIVRNVENYKIAEGLTLIHYSK